jgi:hypothetical protein
MLAPPLGPAEYAAVRSTLMKGRARHRRTLGGAARDAVDAYFNEHADGCAMKLNRCLMRQGACAPSLRRLTRLLDDALASASPVPPTVEVLYRGLRGPVGRALLDGWRAVGSERRFAGFLSCSFMPLQALLYCQEDGCLLRMHLAGDEAHLFGPTEDEIMLPRGSTWRLLRRRLVRTVPARAGGMYHPADSRRDYAHIVPRRVWCLDVEQVHRPR